MNVQYECLGDNDYLITAHIFRDCAQLVDLEIGQIPIPAYITSSCETIGFVPLILEDSLEVSQLCPDSLPFSSCNGGDLPGVYLYVYQAITTIPPCDDWQIIVIEGNRADVLNLQDPLGNSSRHVEAFLNNADDSCNSSAQLGLLTLPFVCTSDQFFYNLSFIDPDGDSLAYSLTPALRTIQGQGVTPTSMTYEAAFSPGSPINSLNFISSTGQMNIETTQEGKYTVVVEVKEFRNGVQIGAVYFDFNVIVIPCPVAPPVPVPGTLTQVSGGGYPLSESQVGICAGDDFCLQLDFSSESEDLELMLEADIEEDIPGATFTQIGTNPATIELCGTLPSDFTSGDFVVSARDNFCPIFGQAFFAIEFVIRDPLIARSDTTVCAGESVQLNAENDISYTWFDLQENQIPVNGSFSCNPCKMPIATMDTTTAFVVQGEFTDGICASRDTVIISVPLSTEITVVPETCLEDDGIIDISILTGSGDYTVTWDDGATNDLIRENLNAGSYSVSITDNTYSCQFSETFNVENLIFPEANAGENNFVCGTEYQLSATPSFGMSQWSSGDLEIGFDNPDSPNTIVTSSTPGIYELIWTEDDDQGSGNGCIDSDTLTLEFFEIPQASISSSDSVCGSVIQISIDNSTFLPSWETSGNVVISNEQENSAVATSSAEGTEEVIFFSINGPCIASDTVIIRFIDQPLADAGSGEIVCGNEIDLSANTSVGSGFWLLPDEIDPLGANEANLSIAAAEYDFFELIWIEENQDFCLDSDTIEIGFVEQPVLGTLDDVIACGNELIVNATVSAGIPTWEGGLELNISAPNTLSTGILADFGTYDLTLNVDNGFGCEASELIQLTFLEQPEGEDLLSETICGLEAELLAPETDFQIQWISENLTLSSVDDQAISVSTQSEGEFEVELVLSNQETCFDTSTYLLTFYELPIPNVPEDFSVCGLSTSIEAAPSFNDVFWTSNGLGEFTHPDSSTTSFTNENFGEVGLLLAVTNGPCSVIDSLLVEFQPPPLIQNTEFVCTGVDALFELTFEVGGDFGNGYLITGLEGDLSGNVFTSTPLESGSEVNLTLSNFSVCENASFQDSHGCPIISSSGSMISDTIRVCGNLNAIADQLSAPELDGNDVLRYILHDSETSDVGSIFSWSEIPVFSYEAPLLLNEVYYISPVVGNPNGEEVDLLNPQVSVGAGQPVIFLPDPQASLNYDEIICPTENAVIEVQFSGNFPQLFTYVFNGVQSSIEVNSPTIELTFSDSGAVEPISISSQNCVGQIVGSAVISYLPEPIMAVDWDSAFCTGDMAEVEVEVEGEAPFFFDFGEVGSTSLYEVYGDTLLTIQNGGDYIVSGFTDQLCPFGEEIIIAIDELPIPEADAGLDILVCNGDSVVIGTTSLPGNTYSWSGSESISAPWSATPFFVGENQGSFSIQNELILEVSNGSCTNSDTLQIDVFPQPSLQIFAQEHLCQGDSLLVVGFGASDLKWEPAFLFTNSDSAQSVFYSEVSSVITLTGENEAGCTSVVTSEIEISPVPNVDFVASEESGCEPLAVSFEIISPSTNVAYEWSINNEFFDQSFEAFQAELREGSYEISLSGISAEGCSKKSDSPVRIEVYGATASFDHFPEEPSISNPEVNFFSTSENGEILFWEFDSLATGEGDFVTFNFPTDFGSDYLICLQVISQEGCFDSFCEVITIEDDFYIYVPTAFTPNGDGLNDLFFPQLSQIDLVEYRFWITNRDGRVVFETRDPQGKWDGSENNSGFYGRTDLYQWHLEAKPEFSSEERFYTGSVMMIR
ncbi:MAG: gliding motility-associated C-terminal domain-containing protein [Bacteroidota bacterium]